MKKLLYLGFLVLIFVGCSYKNEPLNLSSYKNSYTGALAKENSTVYINFVKDNRIDKSAVGHIKEGSNKSVTLSSNVDFSLKYKQGLTSALKVAGFKVVNKPTKASIIMSVNIEKINLVKKDNSFHENLEGEIKIAISIKQGSKTIKQNFKQKAAKWIKPTYSSGDLESFLYELFSDNINNIVKKLTTY